MVTIVAVVARLLRKHALRKQGRLFWQTVLAGASCLILRQMLLCQFNQNLIDFGGQNKIVFRQTSNGVRPYFDGHIAVAFDM